MTSPEMNRRVGQLRHDVDDVYELVEATNQTVATLAVNQQQHGTWLVEIRQRVDRMEDAQREQGAKLDTILTLLRDQRPSE